jgi:hypothetical protein
MHPQAVAGARHSGLSPSKQPIVTPSNRRLLEPIKDAFVKMPGADPTLKRLTGTQSIGRPVNAL